MWLSTDGERLRVLLVDDHLDDLTVTRIYLEKLGCEVQATDLPIEAVALAEQLRPHLILLDIGMPGMSGIEMARALKASNAQPFLLVARTAHAHPKVKHDCLAAGFNLVLIKPSDTGSLAALLNTACKFAFPPSGGATPELAELVPHAD